MLCKLYYAGIHYVALHKNQIFKICSTSIQRCILSPELLSTPLKLPAFCLMHLKIRPFIKSFLILQPMHMSPSLEGQYLGVTDLLLLVQESSHHHHKSKEFIRIIDSFASISNMMNNVHSSVNRIPRATLNSEGLTMTKPMNTTHAVHSEYRPCGQQPSSQMWLPKSNIPWSTFLFSRVF